MTRTEWKQYVDARRLLRACPCMRDDDKRRMLTLPPLYVIQWVAQARFATQAREGWRS